MGKSHASQYAYFGSLLDVFLAYYYISNYLQSLVIQKTRKKHLMTRLGKYIF